MDKADAELSSVLVVNAAVGMEGYVVTNLTAQYLSGGEDIVCRTEEISFDRAVGGARGTYTIDEEFELNYGVKEVLFTRRQGHCDGCAVRHRGDRCGRNLYFDDESLAKYRK